MNPLLKSLYTALLFLSVAYRPVVAQSSATANLPANTLPGGPRLRGFNMPELLKQNFEDIKKTWHANSVRYHIPISQIAQRGHISMEQAFQQVLRDLPAELDAAKANGITVILALPENGIFEENPKLTHDQNCTAFWQDDANLQMIISCWQRLAAVTKGRDQEIWFDLFNEPLDRKQLPGYPKKWPEWAQVITDAVRRIEPDRIIAIEPGPGGLDWGFSTFPLLKGRNIIYSAHSYSPHGFTHQGIADLEHTDLAHAYLQKERTWPGTFDRDGGYWDKNRLEQEFAPVLDFQKRHPGTRIWIGEFSAVRWAPNADGYLRDSISLFEQHGWDWSYHAFREYPGWSLEHDETFSLPDDSKLAPGITKRGAVVMDFMKRNDPVEAGAQK